MKRKNKISSIVLMIIILINSVLPIANSATCELGTDIQLKGYGSVECHVRNKESGDYAITTDLVGYYNNGVFFPAYCLNRGVNGADNSFTHTVNISQILQNDETYNKIWRVVTAGYPYKSAEELGVDDWTYAYQATKTAIYDILGQTDVNNYYGIDETGERTVALMKKLVNIGENGTSTYKTPVATIKKSGDMFFKEDEYIQNYIVTSNVEIESFQVTTTDFPAEVKITNELGEIKDKFKYGEIFQVRMSKDTVENLSFEGRICVEVQTKSYPIFYGKTYTSNLQNYAITADTITLTNASISAVYDAKTASIQIKKIDKDTQQPIAEVTYELINSSTGKVISTGKTNNDGILIFDNLLQGDYIIKEIKTDDNYILSQELINVKAIYNKVTEVIQENELKKGKVKIVKIDKENPETKLQGVKFEVLDKNGNILETIITNEKGEAYTKEYAIRDYKSIIIREKEAPVNYVIDSSEQEIELKENETVTITLENEIKHGKIKINKISGEYNRTLNLPANSPLANTKFLIINEKGENIGTYTTDKTGSILTEELPYGKYTIYEYETPAYFLKDAEPKTISITENNQIIEITFKNMPLEPELPKTGF